MDKPTLGFCLTGSFCTFSEVIPYIKQLSEDYRILPVMSFNAFGIDSRFGKREDFISMVEEYSENKVIHTIEGAEPIGAKGLCDIMLVAPCTGNTAAKLANGITDTPVTMAVKGHLRNCRPVVLAISTNDAMGANYKNIGILTNTKNIYFVPYWQDDPAKKPMSLMADFSMIKESLEAAVEYRQLQPIIKIKKR